MANHTSPAKEMGSVSVVQYSKFLPIFHILSYRQCDFGSRCNDTHVLRLVA